MFYMFPRSDLPKVTVCGADGGRLAAAAATVGGGGGSCCLSPFEAQLHFCP